MQAKPIAVPVTASAASNVPPHQGLNDRERALVGYLPDGLSNDEIAASMGNGTRAVEAHLARLYQRFEVQTRAELAVRAVREGWLDIPVS